VYSSGQNATRKIAVRIFIFVLTASLGQGLAYLMKAPHRSSLRVIAPTMAKPVRSSSPVSVENAPQIFFPKSLSKVRLENFSIPLTMVVNSDGTVGDIHVDLDKAHTVQGLSLYDEVSSKTKGKQASEITSELVECLTTEMQRMTFRPRTSNGESLATVVYVNSQFRSYDNSCREIESDFRTSQSVFWGVIFRNQSSCFSASVESKTSK
jgi:hypothetical protein